MPQKYLEIHNFYLLVDLRSPSVNGVFLRAQKYLVSSLKFNIPESYNNFCYN